MEPLVPRRVAVVPTARRAARAVALIALALGLLLVLGQGGPAQAAPAPPPAPAPGAAAPVASGPDLLGLLGPASGKPGLGPAGKPAPPASATPGTYLHENFEAGNLLGTVFTPTLITATPTPTGTPGWAVVTSTPHAGSHVAYATEPDTVTDERLTSLYPVAVPTNATSAVLSFWHQYNLEATGYDGAVLETSIDDGATWRDVLSDTTFINGGYTGHVRSTTGNPLGGRMAWINTLSSYGQVQVDLLPFQGHAVLFRFRLGTDDSNSGSPTGWWVDDVNVTIDAPCGLGAWDIQSPYPNPIGASGGVVHNGALYSFGGSSDNITYTAQAERYDPAAHVWTALADMPAARADPAAVSDGSAIYLAGGSDGNAVSRKDFWRYDPASDSYTTRASLLVSATAASAVYLDGKIYLIGGVAGTGPAHTVQVYTIATNSWALSAAPYPLPIAGAAARVDNGHIIVAGGLTTGSQATTYTASYDPASNTWTDYPIPPLPAPRYLPVSGVLGNHWILAGGVASGYEFSSTIGLNLTTSTWESLPPLRTGAYAAAGGVLGNALYVVGGGDGGHTFGDATQRYTETACATPSPTPGPSPTACGLSFSDVHSTDYFYTPVLYLACNGIISGYADGTFRPYANTTRAQQVKIVVLGYGKPIATPTAGAYTFHDVPVGAPFFDVIETAAADSIVSGYACGGVGEPCDSQSRPYFRPNANVTRGQLSKIDVVAAGWALQNPASATYADVGTASPFYTFVETASCHGVISGYACGGPGEPCDGQHRPYFRPGNNATRGQIAKIVYLSLTAGGACAP